MLAALARWFGRTLAIWLMTVMAVALILESVVSSLADPSFYVDRLRNARAYETVLNDAMRPAIADALASPAGRASGLTERRVLTAVRRALPPNWVYSQLETQLAGPLGYLAGDSSRFTFRVSLRSRIPTMIDETASLARAADVQAILLDGIAPGALADAAAEMRSYGLDVDEDRLRQSAMAILTEQWLDASLSEIIDEAGPYIAGESNSFEIVISLDEPLAAAESEVRSFVAEVDWYDAALDGFVSGYVDESLKDVDKTLGGFTVNREDVLEIIRSSVTRDIAEPVIADTAAQFTAYFLGASDTASVTIDLTEAKRRAAPRIGEFGAQIADARALTTPACADALAAARTLIIFGVRMPACVPQDEPARTLAQESLKTARGRMGDAFIQTVIAPLPDAMTFTHEDARRQLRANAGEGALDAIDAVRAAAKDGIRYTDQDLESHIVQFYGYSALSSLRDAQNFLRNGWRFNQNDMRNALSGELVDLARTYFPYARLASFGGIALAIIMAALSGALIGRSARGRLIAACGVFALAGAVSWVLFEPVYAIYAQPRIADALRDAIGANAGGQYSGLVQDMAMDAISGIVRRASIGGAICFLAGGTVALLVMVGKPRPPRPRGG